MPVAARRVFAFLTAALWWSAVALAQQSSDAPRSAAQPAQAGYETSELVDAAHQLIADDLPILQARADMGDARSQVLLGLAYEMGSAGLKPQPPQALAWFLKAAAQGIPWAEAWAADFYFSGSAGVERDFSKALTLYQSAAAQGDTKAAFFIGQMYFYGDGVAANHRAAATWYHRALATDPVIVQPMIDLAESTCESAFCVALRQVVAAIMTGAANRFVDGWDDARKEWDANITLPDNDRCGLTSADRTNVGEVQNYFCDSAAIADETRGVALAKTLADQVQSALPSGYARSERSDMRPGPSTFFAKDGYPHIRVTFNVTPGSAERRVTLLVGP
jgi:hypothetical protein